MNIPDPHAPETSQKSAGFVGVHAGLLLILLALITHVGYLVGQHYGYPPIVIAITSIVLFLPPLAYAALAAHYNNYLFVAILVYGALHVFVLPGTEYMMPAALAVWWGMAGLAALVAGFAAYRRFFGNS